MSNTDEIRKLYQQYTKYLDEGNFKAVGDMYTKDGVLIPPDQPPLTGSAQICEHYAASSVGEYEMELEKIETSNRLAWVMGNAHWEENEQRRRAAFVDVWRKEAGQWRIAACIANSKEGFVQD